MTEHEEGAQESAAMGVALEGFAAWTETPAAKIAVTVSKVALFNLAIFGPIAALLAMAWSRLG